MKDDTTNWIPIFKAGDYTAAGLGNYPVARLKAIVDDYSEATAAACIGHVDQQTPRLADVQELKLDGDTLFCRLKNVNEDFRAAVRAKLYNRISPRFAPNPITKRDELKHVGFFGAYPTIQKELLPAANFAEAEASDLLAISVPFDGTVDFAERGNTMLFTKEQEEAIMQMIADAVKTASNDFAERLEKATTPPAAPEGGDGASLLAQANDFAEKAVAKATTAILEKLENFGAIAKQATTKLHEVGIRDFCEKLISEGRMLPHELEAQVRHMMSLGTEAVMDFSEADGTNVKISQLESHQRMMAARAAVIQYGEHKSVGGGNVADFAEKDLEAEYNGYKAQGKIGCSLDSFKKNPDMYRSAMPGARKN